MDFIKNILRISVISIFLLIYTSSKAQKNFIIKGYVLEQGDSIPLANYPVVIYPDTLDMSKHFTVYTSQSGFFYLSIPFTEPATLLLELKSYCLNDWKYVYDTVNIYDGVYSNEYYVCNKYENTQDYVIYGIVSDKETGNIVANQKIFIYDEKNTIICHYVNTDKYGYYSDTISASLKDTLNLIIATESFCNDDRNIISKCIYLSENSIEVNFEICSKNETNYDVTFFYKMYQNSNKVYFSALCNFDADSIKWEFGDNTTGTGEDIYHIYSSGSYKVRIFAYKNGHSYTYSERVVVGQTVTLTGKVYFSDTLCPNGYVVAYKQNSFKGTTYDIIKTTKIINGNFYFSNLIKGEYIFYAIPKIDLSENYFPKYIATYNSGDNYWQEAMTTSIDRNTECVIHLSKYEEVYYGHNNIYISTEKRLLEQIDIVNIYLLDEHNEIINSKYLSTDKISDIFTNLPDGTYTVVSEVSGQYSIPRRFTLSSGENIYIYFYENNGEINSTVQTNNIAQVTDFKIFPNPFTGSFFVDNESDVFISIYDLAGNKKFEKFTAKKELITPPNLITGIYIIEIKNMENQVVSRQIIEKR